MKPKYLARVANAAVFASAPANARAHSCTALIMAI